MKRLVAWTLVLAMAMSAVGCTKKEEVKTETVKTETSVETKTEEKAEETVEEVAEAAAYANPESIISAAELKEVLGQDNLVVVDLREKMMGGGYIPGAVKVVESEFGQVRDGVKGMRPDAANFEALMSSKGIEKDDTVVLYDENRMMTAARVWWIMKVYGHENVKILNGAIGAWEAAGYETDSKPAEPAKSEYKADAENQDIIATLELVKTTYTDDTKRVIDTRSEKEWNAGRIPGATWIEWSNNLNEDGTWKSVEDLKAMYEAEGLTPDLEVIIPHCKSAWRSAHTMFALQELLGYENIKNYDGSWLEFSASGEEIDK